MHVFCVLPIVNNTLSTTRNFFVNIQIFTIIARQREKSYVDSMCKMSECHWPYRGDLPPLIHWPSFETPHKRHKRGNGHSHNLSSTRYQGQAFSTITVQNLDLRKQNFGLRLNNTASACD
jgi:hypothetical protein